MTCFFVHAMRQRPPNEGMLPVPTAGIMGKHELDWPKLLASLKYILTYIFLC